MGRASAWKVVATMVAAAKVVVEVAQAVPAAATAQIGPLPWWPTARASRPDPMDCRWFADSMRWSVL